MLCHSGDQADALAAEWLVKDDPILRRAAAVWAAHRRVSQRAAKQPVLAALRDRDAEVRDEALTHLTPDSLDDELTEWVRAASDGAVGWRCMQCGRDNVPEAQACEQCHTTGPELRRHIDELLDG